MSSWDSHGMDTAGGLGQTPAPPFREGAPSRMQKCVVVHPQNCGMGYMILPYDIVVDYFRAKNMLFCL